jgi:hypothetical protein
MGIEERAQKALAERQTAEAVGAHKAAIAEQKRSQESEEWLMEQLGSWFEELGLVRPPRDSFTFEHWTAPYKHGIQNHIMSASFVVERLKFYCRVTEREQPVVHLIRGENKEGPEIKALADLGAAMQRPTS